MPHAACNHPDDTATMTHPMPTSRFALAATHACAALLLAATVVRPAAAQDPAAMPATVASPDSGQQRWTWRAVPGGSDIPWPAAFAFSEILPVNDQVLPGRWLSLTPRDTAWMPAFHDTVAQRLVTLAPQARSLCPGVTIDRVVKALHARSSGLTVQVRYTLRFPDGRSRASGGAGEIDADGQWSRYPFGTTMPRPEGCPASDTVLPPPAAVLMDVPSVPTRLERVEVLGQPALRERATGRWMTPAPPHDPVLAQWQTWRLADPTGTSTGFGVVNAAGELVVPLVFGSLTDVKPNATLQATLSREGNLRHQEQPVLRVPSAASFARGFRTAQAANGLWGYRTAHGGWAVPPQFDSARPFVNGYAVVSGRMPADWRPPGAAADALQQPLVRSVTRLGHAWVIGVAAPVEASHTASPAADGRVAPLRGGRAVMDDEGQWLVPEPVRH